MDVAIENAVGRERSDCVSTREGRIRSRTVHMNSPRGLFLSSEETDMNIQIERPIQQVHGDT